MNRKSLAIGLALSCVIIVGGGKADAGKIPSQRPNAELLTTGIEGGSGSTLGPGGALYVTEAAAGKISRVDPQTGEITTFASGLPKPAEFPFGGAVDVAFIGKTAYVLVTLVGSDVGGSDIVGIYRVDGPDRFTVVADIGKFSEDNPPNTDFFVPTGVQYALEPYRGGFLVTDGHHNRLLRVTLNGEVSELIALDNIVLTGLAVSGDTVYMAEAGPVPHLPQDGRVVSFDLKLPHCGINARSPHERSKTKKGCSVRKVASGASLLVDVEFGRGHRLYALSQGEGSPGAPEGSPAVPNTGALVKVKGDGTFTVVTDGLDRPTSLEFIGDTAYVVTITGEIWRIDGVSR
jgi:hypothetical protein